MCEPLKCNALKDTTSELIYIVVGDFSYKVKASFLRKWWIGGSWPPLWGSPSQPPRYYNICL